MHAEISGGAVAQAMDVALTDAQRAVDNAVRTMFELARSLELLTEAIGNFRDETRHEIGEWQHLRAGPEGGVSE